MDVQGIKLYAGIFLASLLQQMPASAQRSRLLTDDVATLQVTAGNDWQSMPVATLGDRPIVISFDGMTHEYRRYTYRIEHMEADWTPSRDLFSSDYISGFEYGNTIDPYGESENVNTQYTHYRLTIPNDRCSLAMSGNYKLTVYDENNNMKPVLEACFMLSEQTMPVKLGVTTSTDIDINGSHQQVEAEVRFGNYNVTDPERQIKTVVMQNGRWDNARRDTRPQQRNNEMLKWTHCNSFIFNAGNIYRKIDMLSVTHPTMGVENINWDGSNYHVWKWTDEPRPNYVYDESAQGAFYIRNSDNDDNDVQTDYVWLHLRLKAPRQPGDVYVNGDWTYDRFDDKYKMSWNDEKKIYETALFLKQGYYSFQYVTLFSDGTAHPVSTEGNFYQTANKYQMLVYFRGNGDRTDRLTGYQQVTIKP